MLWLILEICWRLTLCLRRKTGLTVPDSGVRDEYGLEPMDDLFSSPEKPSSGKRSSLRMTMHATMSDEEDMDVAESMAPCTVNTDYNEIRASRQAC
jgi:hypothetical protein